MKRNLSVSAVTAGFLAVLISYSGPLVIFIQAAQSANISIDMMSSWVWAISMGAGVSGIFLSWLLKVPVVTAWSAPGTALLVTLFPALSLEHAVGAYLVSAVMIFAVGVTGYFDKLMSAIPRGIANAMMAGILFQFGVGAFQSVATMPALTFAMIGIYLLFRRLLPRYCLVILLLAGLALALVLEDLNLSGMSWVFASPVFIQPEWSWGATLSLAVPLFLVSVTGQFFPGMTILRAAGYSTPSRPIIITTSLASIAVAFFGGITIVIAAITAALCTGKDAHENPEKRYIAGIANGVFYLVGACFAGTIILFFTTLPKALIGILAGLALLGAIASSLTTAMAEADHREASVVTFLCTASGMTFGGLGSAFWGVVVGLAAYLVLHKTWRRAEGPFPRA